MQRKKKKREKILGVSQTNRRNKREYDIKQMILLQAKVQNQEFKFNAISE